VDIFMTSTHWNVLLIYLCFTLVATLLALARRWLRPGASEESVWHKYPAYILINLSILAACWSPLKFHALTILLALIGALASWELARMIIPPGQRILFPTITLALIVSADFLDSTAWFKVWLATLFLSIAINTLTVKPAEYPKHVLLMAGCVIYLPLCLAVYIWIRQNDPSGFRAVFLYLVVATNDAFAQITGQLLGRRQLSPQVSPSKTMEGAIGGVLFAAMMGIAMSQATGFTYFTGLVFGFILGLAGLVGDLTASMWKRTLNLKNYSTLLGAQGGVLDRFDGLFFAALLFYLLLVIAS
jgi:phosphatidate cytidylyltransferase